MFIQGSCWAIFSVCDLTRQVCCCSMPCWPSKPTKPTPTKTKAGRRSLTPWCSGSATTRKASSSCCGDRTLRRKEPLLTGWVYTVILTPSSLKQSFYYVHASKLWSLWLQKRHHVLQAVHPSPLSAHRGFFGCRHFSKANELLKKSGKSPIDWTALWVVMHVSFPNMYVG